MLDNLQIAYSADRRTIEFAIPKAAIGTPPVIKTLFDVNDTVFGPTNYSAQPYIAYDNNVSRTDPSHKIGIVYSATTAAHYFSPMAYSQLFMAVQSQAMQAGISFDTFGKDIIADFAASGAAHDIINIRANPDAELLCRRDEPRDSGRYQRGDRPEQREQHHAAQHQQVQPFVGGFPLRLNPCRGTAATFINTGLVPKPGRAPQETAQMCGIVGVIGGRAAVPIILGGLQRVEYRGYDSAGIATLVEGRIERRRAPGKLAALEGVLGQFPLPGTTGIGHTRWATHGAPTEVNAHPHGTARVCVVHNGIIENHRRAAGRARGVRPGVFDRNRH